MKKRRNNVELKKEILDTINREEFITPSHLSTLLNIHYTRCCSMLYELEKENKIETEMRGNYKFLRIKNVKFQRKKKIHR